jgi:hypothetical protein
MKNRDFHHPALHAFAPHADAFCALVENRAGLSAKEQLRRIHEALPALYAAALALPKPRVLFDDTEDADPDSSPGSPDPDSAESPEAKQGLAPVLDLLGQRSSYREVFDPYDPDAAEVMGSLEDDLISIHQELRSGLLKWNRGEAGKALWEWRFNFEIHWSEHATSALRALYALCARSEIAWPNGK